MNYRYKIARYLGGTLQTSDISFTKRNAAENCMNRQVNPQQWFILKLGGLKDICARAVKKYGKESRKRMAVEEAAELVNALMKEARGRVTDADIITEIADVQIMMEQLSIIYGYEKVARERERKLERLVAQMNNG